MYPLVVGGVPQEYSALAKIPLTVVSGCWFVQQYPKPELNNNLESLVFRLKFCSNISAVTQELTESFSEDPPQHVP